ncbi:hypothetical protein [Mycobacterium sp. 1245805.9]|uniref:hypothetical protein n=1 Tax=Mycobacterium sp. 1245805.9 TaxID=1856862 RepID=UPI0007FE9348|nr:hypothetical protein [Mycobacterium sp. 1245805.9]OBI82681.1 hypothetical protein A9X00_06955 [Mycobacterium sp. 1245805.9]
MNFGNGIVTAPATVAVVTSAILNGVAYSTAQLPAILGVGVNPGGPPSTSPVTTLLYTTTVGAQQASVASSLLGGFFNTGIAPFLQHPIYFSYSPTGFGTMTFDT